MRKLIGIFVLLVVAVSCSEAPEDVLKKKISDQEKVVKKLSKDTKKTLEVEAAKGELISNLLEYYHEFPKDKYSANCLSKVHMLYSSLNEEKMAVAYADTLISKYPKFVDRSQMIESQIAAYEMSIRPRNTQMIEKYLKLWLKENKKASKDKISEMKYHLKHVDMSLEERIRLNMQELK